MAEIEQYSFGPYGPFVALKDHEQALAEIERENVKTLAQIDEERGRDLAEKDREIAHLKEKVAHYDRWLSAGVYFTGEEYQEQVYKPRQQLMTQAVQLAKAYCNAHLSNWLDLVIAERAEEMAVEDPVYVEARAFLKEHQL